jgi:hypothetical protein
MMGLAPDPVAAYLASGYGEAISSERKAGSPRAGELDTHKRRQATARVEQPGGSARVIPRLSMTQRPGRGL